MRLCFAMTINKSQGQSFRWIRIDLREQVFTHRQFYIAVSRVTDMRRLLVLFLLAETARLDNIVYLEVLIQD